jgi:hypothetical protein
MERLIEGNEATEDIEELTDRSSTKIDTRSNQDEFKLMEKDNNLNEGRIIVC